MDNECCQNVIRSFKLSRLDYGSCLLGGISKRDLTRLQRIQNKCARLVYMKPKWSHATPLLRSLHWLPVEKRIKFRLLCQTFKTLQNALPSYIYNFFDFQKSAYSLRSTSAIKLVVPKSRINIGMKSFSSLSARLWNNLPRNIKQSASLESFKKLLKTHLFLSNA